MIRQLDLDERDRLCYLFILLRVSFIQRMWQRDHYCEDS